MVGCDSMDQVDCGSFFNEIEFPDENLRSVSYNDYQTIWPGSNTIFSGSNSSNNYNSNGTSDLFAELFVPYEDIVQLEWLSNFVEDSFSGGGMTLDKENTSSTNKADPSHNQFQTSSPISVLDSSSSSSSSSSSNASLCLGDKTVAPSLPIQTQTQRGPQRARSKRPRPPTFNPRPKIQLISPTSSITENPQSLSESENFVESHPMKKMPKALTGERKKKRTIKLTIPLAPREVEMDENMNQNQNPPSQAMRKCMHCEITKTPQWRAGPMGPKTLCNACGVRYKSGRLFPEYRPAASPTFSPTIHSNSHKKVLEMRTKGDDSTSITITAIATPPDLIPNTNPSLDYA